MLQGLTESLLLSSKLLESAIGAGAPAETFANLLLTGETDGFAIDATDVSGTPAYVGAPFAGWVSVIDTGTPANDKSNVPLDISNLVQSGTSPKMVPWNSSPYLRWTPHNLWKRSQEIDDNATWTKNNLTVTADQTTAPDGTSTADKIMQTTASGIHSIDQTSTSTSGFRYTASCYVKPIGTQQYINWSTNSYDNYFDIINGTATPHGAVTATITSAGSGWYYITISWIAGANEDLYMFQLDSSHGVVFTGVDTDGIYAWGFQLQRGPIATPYLVTTSAARIGIPQSYDTAASKYGILNEPAATNLINSSEGFSSGDWATFASASITADNTTAPDGASTADLMTAVAGVADHVVFAFSSIASNTSTCSCFFKQGTAQYVTIAVDVATNDWWQAVFDLTNGTVTNTQAGSSSSIAGATITTIGNGWYRATATGTTSATSNPLIRFSDVAVPTMGGDGHISFTAAGTETVYLWGFQGEAGTIATSYIPTLDSPVVRAADIVKAAKTTFPWSDTNGSIYAKYKPLDISSGSRYVWQSYKDANNHISLVGVTADPKLENTQASTQDVLLDAGTLVAGTLTRVSGAYKANDFDVSQDAAAVQSDGASTLTTGYTDLYIGTKGSATTEELNGYIYQILYVPYQRQTVTGDIDTWKNAA